MQVRQAVGALLVMTTLGASLAVVTTAQAKPQAVSATESDDGNGHKSVTYQGRTYSVTQAVKLGLISDSSVNAKENRWAYQLTKVKVKRTKSKKSVKVTGKLVVTNIPLSVFTPAKKVMISTGGAPKYAKLSKRLTFSRTVKTKAKKVNLRAGYWVKVKGHKSFFVLSANKNYKVKAYK